MSIFKAYDIRGTYPDQIDASKAFRIGAAMVRFLSAKRLVVGRDMREMAPSVSDAFIEGVTRAGSNAVRIGFATAPIRWPDSRRSTRQPGA